MTQMNLLMKQKGLTDIENKLTITRGERGLGGINYISRYKLLYIKYINSKVLLLSIVILNIL